MEAHILAVSDVVEAMASHRPYRAGLGIDVALSEIEKNIGATYETKAARACLELFRQHQYSLDMPEAF
jgi:HD-GYP domain-containing protein (c-di-GMP phosphodiesterase class II)